MKRNTFFGLTFYGWYILLLIILIVVGLILTCSCTDNTIARVYGGTLNIALPRGQKLVEATWKNNNLWYLTEPMDSNYSPKTKIFKEDSRFGVLEGTVNFIERR